MAPEIQKPTTQPVRKPAPAPQGPKRAPEAPKAPEAPNHARDFFTGFAAEGVDTAKGIYNLVTTNPITTAKGLVYMATHPVQAVTAIAEPYTTAYKAGRYGELAGRASFQVLTMVLTSGALSGTDDAAKTGQVSATATEAAQKVTTDLAADIAKKRAVLEVERLGVPAARKGAEVSRLIAQYKPFYAEKFAARGIADKVAQGIASSGVADDAVTKVMGASGGKLSAANTYKLASAGMKAGLTADQIAAKVGEFASLSSSKAAAQAPVAIRLMQAQAAAAPLIAGAASPGSAVAIANRIQQFERMAAGTTDEAVKAGYQAQIAGLKQAAAANPHTSKLVEAALRGEKIGRFEQAGANVGTKIDNVGHAVDGAAERAGQLKQVLDGDYTIGKYGELVASVPAKLGHGVDRAVTAAVETLRRGIAHLPKLPEINLPSLDDVGRLPMPSPWDVMTSPVTVPVRTAGWALKHPGRALGVAGVVGNFGRATGAAEELMRAGPAPVTPPVPTPPATPGGREYALQAGDTLESIAEKQLGDKRRWNEIYALNRELFESLGPDGNIPVGTKIKLPADGPPPPPPSGEKPAPGKPEPTRPAPGEPAEPGTPEAEAYKAALLRLVDEKAKTAAGDAKKLLDELKQRLAVMPADEVLALKPELEAQGLLVESGAEPAPPPGKPAPKPAPKPPTGEKPAPGKPAPTKPAPVPARPAPLTPRPAQPFPSYTEYAVVRNNTLTGVAQEQLGDWRRWRELVALNKDRYPSLASNPDFVQVGWKLRLPSRAPSAPEVAQPTPAQRQKLVQQFNLEKSDANWNRFWSEVNTYPTAAVGPDAGTDAQRRAMQQRLVRLGFPVNATGSYYSQAPNGQPKLDAQGLPESPTAEAVIAFKRAAGIHQSYNVIGANGRPTPDVNEYVDPQTDTTMRIATRLMEWPELRTKAKMTEAIKEAQRLSQEAIGPEVGTPQAKALVQQYLKGLGYDKVEVTGEFDAETTGALVDFKRKHGVTGIKGANGEAIYTPYVDPATSQALYQAALQLQARR